MVNFAPTISESLMQPTGVRKVFLGKDRCWEPECLSQGIIRIGFDTHLDRVFAMCRRGDWNAFYHHYIEAGRSTSKAGSFREQTKKFFNDDGSTLWVTSTADGAAYWGLTLPPLYHDDSSGTWRCIRAGWKYVVPDDDFSRQVLQVNMPQMTVRDAPHPLAENLIKYVTRSMTEKDFSVGQQKRVGQGFNLNQQQRRLIEQYAMARAIEHFSKEGWTRVNDVSAHCSYDLQCSATGKVDLHVEVKGTTSAVSEVFLTRNEVEHALDRHPNTALFLLTGVRLLVGEGGSMSAEGGTPDIRYPWSIEEHGELKPMQYRYMLRSIRRP